MVTCSLNLCFLSLAIYDHRSYSDKYYDEKKKCTGICAQFDYPVYRDTIVCNDHGILHNKDSYQGVYHIYSPQLPHQTVIFLLGLFQIDDGKYHSVKRICSHGYSRLQTELIVLLGQTVLLSSSFLIKILSIVHSPVCRAAILYLSSAHSVPKDFDS